jgi:hypothetical protein
VRTSGFRGALPDPKTLILPPKFSLTLLKIKRSNNALEVYPPERIV